MNNESIIVTQDLSRLFGSLAAVDKLTFHVNRGELFGIVGPDGAGKTTTMRMLAGILEPSSGDAWINGVSITKDPEGIKESLAYMPQRFGLYQDLTVMENLIFYADLFQTPKKERSARIEKLFGFSRLGPFKDRAAGALSGGMKQKLGLACALIHEPQLLLLDEPTNGVDPVSRRDFWKILYDLLKEGISILVTTAYLDEAERAGRVALMNNGSVMELGKPEELKAKTPGVIVEFITPDPSTAKSVIEKIPEVQDANIFGEGLHLRISDNQASERVKTELERRRIEVQSFKRIEPSMEDAFLYLIQRDEKKPDTEAHPTE